jgi:dTDP-4-dehydrorhamnose reductase
MKVLVLGGTGMLGHKLVQRLSNSFDVYATIRGSFAEIERFGIFRREKTIEHLDLTDPGQISHAIETAEPDAVINAAGVIKQVPNSADVINTLTINSILPHRLAQLSQRYGFRLFIISTDCVFGGERGNYRETDVADAADLYGRSKNLGEVSAQKCLTIRTSIIGRELNSAHSLLEWFLRNRGGTVMGYTKAIFSGFPTIVFADIIADLLANHPDLDGLYHVSSEPISKYDLLLLLNDAFDVRVHIEPSDSIKIDRSLDSARFRKATGFRPAGWTNMIETLVRDNTPYKDFR